MKRHSSALALLVFAIFALAGCASPPTDVFDAARARVAATGAEGSAYAADEYGVAQETVRRMDAEVAAQGDQFAMTRSYERATELAGETESAADAVERAVETEKQRLRMQATQLVGDAETAIAGARDDVADLAEAAAAPLLDDLAAAETSVAAANDALGRDDLTGAVQESESALRLANGVTTSLMAMRTESEPDAVTPETDVLRAVRGGIDIPRPVYVDGRPLPAGAYTLRLGEGGVPPVPSEGPTSTRWVEFVSDEDASVAGRGLSAVIPDAEIGEVADGWVPRNQASVAELLGGEYLRIWLNRGGVSYLVHATTAAP